MTNPAGPVDRTPSIVLASEKYADQLLDEFGRYARDYHLITARSCAEALTAARAVLEQHGSVALFATDARLPDVDVFAAFAAWQKKVPTARRVVVSPWEWFTTDRERLRPGLAKGKFDAYLLMPRGPRDEEFHYAITELLSDWGSTVPDPEAVSVKIIAPQRDRLVLEIQDFLDRMGMPNRVYPPDSDVAAYVAQELPADAGYPRVRAFNGISVVPTAVRDVARSIYGRPEEIDLSGTVDLCIVGAGPAGLASAVYGASEGLSTVVLEAEAVGGQAGTSSMIRNYLGFPRGISGMRLAQRARNQAIRFGTQFYTGWSVHDVRAGTDGASHLVCTDGGEVQARAVVIAAGAKYRKLGVPAVEDLVGFGVNYGAALTAAREIEGQDVVVVGGGNSAGQAAVHLSRTARSVTILVRREALAETMSSYLLGEISYNPRISVETCSQVIDAGGTPRLEWICIEDVRTGERRTREIGGLFLLLGADPYCDWLPLQVARDPRGFVLTGRDVPKSSWTDGVPPSELATTVPGIFAVGDIRAGSMKRVASASGEGASVVPAIHAWLAGT